MLEHVCYDDISFLTVYDYWNGAAKGGLQFGCEYLIWLPLSVHVCIGFVVEDRPFVGARTRHSYSKLSYLCLISLLRFCDHPHHPRAPPTHPLIYTGPILMNSIKKHKNLAKTSHYLLIRLIVQKLKDNYVSIIMLSEWLHYQGKAGFLIEFL